MGYPTRAIFVSDTYEGPGKTSALLFASETTSFLLTDILKVEVHEKSFELMLTVLRSNSIPLLLILPIFLVTVEYPEVVGTGVFNNILVVNLSYKSSSKEILLLNNPNSIP